MSDQTTLDRVRTLVLPIVADLHLDLYDLEFRGGTLRVTIDTPPGSPGGVDLEQIALVTRLVSRDLDHHDPVPGHYTLEVTSPGLERTLRTPAHFQREVGNEIIGAHGMLLGEDTPGGGAIQETTMFSPGPSIYGGTDQVQRNIIGERVLGLPREPDQWVGAPWKDVPRS